MIHTATPALQWSVAVTDKGGYMFGIEENVEAYIQETCEKFRSCRITCGSAEPSRTRYAIKRIRGASDDKLELHFVQV